MPPGGGRDGRRITGTTDALLRPLCRHRRVYGPTSHDIHAFDERVEIESIRLTTQAIALFIADWCGVKAA
jgi:acetylornithine deacetylase